MATFTIEIGDELLGKLKYLAKMAGETPRDYLSNEAVNALDWNKGDRCAALDEDPYACSNCDCIECPDHPEANE